MSEGRNLFLEFQLNIFGLFGFWITKEQLIDLTIVIISYIENNLMLNNEFKKSIVEYLYNSVCAIISNDVLKYEKAKNKEILDILKYFINNSNIEQNIKNYYTGLIESEKILIDLKGN